MSILYCEDEDEIRETGLIFLSELFPDSHITVCKNGVEAIETIQKQLAFDLVVSDSNMPSVNGQKGDGKTLFQFYKNIGLDAPFVICSSCSEYDFYEFQNDKNFYYLPKIKLTLDAKDFFTKILKKSFCATEA